MARAPLIIEVNSQSVAAANIDLDLLERNAIEAGVAIDRLAEGPSARLAQQGYVLGQSMGFASHAALEEAQSISFLERSSIGLLNTARNVTASVAAQNEVMHNFRFSTANVAAQFQDIFVTSQMGMNAWTIGLQQGT